MNPALGMFVTRDPVLGAPGFSISYNGYSYVHGNPVNWTDPSGKILLFVAAVLLGAAAGAVSGAVMDVGMQMLLEGRSWDCIDQDRMKEAAIEGAIMGALGGAVGHALRAMVKGGTILGQAVKLSKTAASRIAVAADLAAGVAYDMIRYNQTPSDALVRNLVSFGIGEAIGYAAGRLMRGARKALSGAGNVPHGYLDIDGKQVPYRQLESGDIEVEGYGILGRGGGGNETIPPRHYTNRQGIRGIQEDGVINASERQWESGCVFCERATGSRRNPMTPREAEIYYGLQRGHGRDYVEFDTRPGELREVTNPLTGRTEWVIDGNVELAGRNPTFVWRDARGNIVKRIRGE